MKNQPEIRWLNDRKEKKNKKKEIKTSNLPTLELSHFLKTK